MPSVRVFFEHQGVIRRVMRLSAGNDASLYVHPIAPTKRYDYGIQRFAANVAEMSFDTTNQLHSSDAPHLSLHRSGQMHIRTNGGIKAGPVSGPPLSDYRGEHVATVTASRAEALPIYKGDRSTLRPDSDHVFKFLPDASSARVCVYVNGYEPIFATEHWSFYLTVTNANLPRPLYVAVAPIAQESLGDNLAVVTIGGFDPHAGAGEAPFLFLQGS